MAPPPQHTPTAAGAQHQQGQTRSGETDTSTPTPASRHRGTMPPGGSERTGRGRGVAGAVGGGRAGGSRPSGLPLSTSAAALGRSGRAAGLPSSVSQSGIPSPAHTIYQHRPSGSTSSRKLSAGFATDGPPSSQPTTGYSSVTASTAPRAPARDVPGPLTSHPTTASSSMFASASRGSFDRYALGPLRSSQTTGNLPAPSYQRDAPRPSLLPVPKSSVATESTHTPPPATVLSRFKAENIPPGLSTSLGGRHRDSLELPSTKKLPRRTSPGARQKSNLNPASTPRLPEQELSSAQPEGKLTTAKKELPTLKPRPTEQAPKQLAEPKPSIPTLPRAEQIPKQSTQQKNNTQLNLPRAQQKEPLPPFPSFPRASEHKNTLPQSHSQQLPRPMFKSKAKKQPPQQQQPQSGIPKSRTFGVFSNLRASLPGFTRNEARRQPAPTMAASAMAAPQQLQQQQQQQQQGHQEQQQTTSGSATTSATTSGAASPSSGDISAGTTPAAATAPVTPKPARRNPRLIYSPQPDEYWTGRFMALQDKLRNEMLQPGNLRTIIAANAEAARAQDGSISSADTDTNTKPKLDAGLPTSNTIACLPRAQTDGAGSASASASESLQQAAAELTSDDKRTRRVFIHLEALCATNEALDNMHAYQQAYARRFNKPHLLPWGGTMEDKEPGPVAGASTATSTVTGTTSGTSTRASTANTGGKDKEKEKERTRDSGKGKGWVGRIFSGGNNKDNDNNNQGSGKKKGGSAQ